MMDENGLSQFEVSPHMHRENMPQAIQVLKKIQAQLAERFPEDPSKAIFL